MIHMCRWLASWVKLARISKHNLDLLIMQCDRWLSEEEGRKNVEKRFKERRKKHRLF